MSSTSGCMGAKYFQEFGPICFDISSASGYMGATYFQEFGLRFLACRVSNVACHGMSTSIVSISSMSCRVRILRVSVSMPCRGHPETEPGFELDCNHSLRPFLQLWILHHPLRPLQSLTNTWGHNSPSPSETSDIATTKGMAVTGLGLDCDCGCGCLVL